MTGVQTCALPIYSGFVELAQALAERIQRESAPDDRLSYGFKLCLSRPPKPAEQTRLQSLWEAERNEGDEKSAWITVARVLLNLDETITRE